MSIVFRQLDCAPVQFLRCVYDFRVFVFFWGFSVSNNNAIRNVYKVADIAFKNCVWNIPANTAIAHKAHAHRNAPRDAFRGLNRQGLVIHSKHIGCPLFCVYGGDHTGNFLLHPKSRLCYTGVRRGCYSRLFIVHEKLIRISLQSSWILGTIYMYHYSIPEGQETGQRVDRKIGSICSMVKEVPVWLMKRLPFRMHQKLILICYVCWTEDWKT